MLILSPMCGPFGQLQGLNHSKMGPDEVEAKVREGVAHLKFCMQLCRMQSDKGRLFMFEHPVHARSCMMNITNNILKMFG